MALQHPPLLPHVKEKQIGLLNSCQAEWGCTENKQKGNWIRGRVHATLNKGTDLRLSLHNWAKDSEGEFWAGRSPVWGRRGGWSAQPGKAAVVLPIAESAAWRYPPCLSPWLHFSSPPFQRVNRKRPQAVPCPPPSGKTPLPRPSQASVLSDTI